MKVPMFPPLLLLMITCSSFAQQVETSTHELSTVMMQSTFRFQCATPTGQSTGTVFILGRPIQGTNTSRYVLVTAAHVLSDCIGDSSVLFARQKDSQGRWTERPMPFPIRMNGKQGWVKNSTADVAALYISLPEGTVPLLVSTDLLADDAALTKFEVHPGDDLNVLGYPLGFEGPGGFPVLRSGRIASYPLVPSKDNLYFLMDFRVFQGNSGGPVFMISYNRYYAGATNIGAVQLLMGLVSEEVSATEELRGLYESRSQRYPLGLAKIVPASIIKDTVNQLPEPTAEPVK